MSLKHELAIKNLQRRVEALESLIQASKAETFEQKGYEAVHRGWGKFSVVGPQGEIEKGLSKDEANAKAESLNAALSGQLVEINAH